MKKIVLLLLLLFTGIVNGQIVNIPDANFKAKLLSANPANSVAKNEFYNPMTIDSNADGEIQVSEALLVNVLDISNAGIADLTGIESFTTLTQLNCNGNLLTALTLALPYLKGLSCNENATLVALDVYGCTSLQYLSCRGAALISIDITPLYNLNQMDVINMPNLESFVADDLPYLTNINFGNCPALTNISITRCNMPSLSINLGPDADTETVVIENCPSLLYLECSNLQANSFSVAGCTNLSILDCDNNQLTTLDLSTNVNLGTLSCSSNSLTTLDVSNNVELSSVFANNNQLTSVNIKNGIYQGINAHFSGNPDLAYICADEAEISDLQSNLFNSGLTNVAVSSYCSFTPGGGCNIITGTVLYDCDLNDLTDPYIKMNINDGTNTGSTFTNSEGNYSFYTQAGNFAIGPDLENPSWFTIAPPSANINFPLVDNSTQLLDFCIAANGIHPDLEVVFVPLNNARPGFDAYYKIIYKNKGNQLQSGTLTLDFDSTKLDYLDSTPTFDTFVPDQLRWNYSNLRPLETRQILLTLQVHTPPDVDTGDTLNFTATVNPVSGDELPTDNIFTHEQTVVNALDPNRIDCLQGNTIALADVGKYLHYNINFENIGTSDATNIVIKDSISASKFNINSLRLLHASHDVETRITGNIVEFIFKNINLPPSNGGPIGGHGNVLFKIETKPDLVVGDEVSVLANIYFDYNAPVETNEALTVISTLSNPDFVPDATVTISPNPTKDKITVTSKNKIQSIQLFDAQGSVLQVIMEQNKTRILDLSNHASGIYFVKVNTVNGSSVEKIMKEN